MSEETDKFWTYRGSLTTPPCYESVIFVLFKDPIQIHQNQVLHSLATAVMFWSHEYDVKIGNITNTKLYLHFSVGLGPESERVNSRKENFHVPKNK